VTEEPTIKILEPNWIKDVACIENEVCPLKRVTKISVWKNNFYCFLKN
jgi:hypothetical protein